MKLGPFIRSHMESILEEWEAFARTMGNVEVMDALALRDHAKQMLLEMAKDLAKPQSAAKRIRKSKGEEAPAAKDTAATKHGELRFTSQFSISQLAAEFRALRATVLRLWAAESPIEADAMLRFNEAIDRALAESIDAFVKRSDSARDLFLGVLGHDLRAPLATIGSAADVVLALMPTPSGLQLGGSIKRATRHMAGMIENLSNYTRIQLGGGMPNKLAMVDLGDLCTDAIVDARSAFPDSEFELVITGVARGSFDPVSLRQLVTNLFVNAAQHGERGAPIEVKLHAKSEHLVLSVANRGRVIRDRELASLFKPLVRHADADSSDIGRTSLGLGLFIAQEVATAHGGDIVATSSAKGVTKFVVTLPTRQTRDNANPTRA